jgi:hypothetical protein
LLRLAEFPFRHLWGTHPPVRRPGFPGLDP